MVVLGGRVVNLVLPFLEFVTDETQAVGQFIRPCKGPGKEDAASGSQGTSHSGGSTRSSMAAGRGRVISSQFSVLKVTKISS